MYFVDRNKITKNLQYLDGLLAILEAEENWLQHDIKKLAIERIGHNIMESMMDVGNLMIDGFIMRDPGSYEDIIDILIDEKVITADLEAPYKAVVGLRKMLVREFIDVDSEEVVDVLTTNLTALKHFSPAVQHYLTNELGARFSVFTRGLSMRDYKAYCFDLDGTVYRGKEGIPSAIAFIHRLQQAGIEPFYVTNNASKTRIQLQEALMAVGVSAPLDHIYSSALVTAKYVALHFTGKKVAMMGSDGIRQALHDEGIEPVEDNPEVFVMGIDRNLNYMALARATVFVQRGATFIATNQDIKFPTEYGFLPGNGSFARLVGDVADVEPIYIGKPSAAILEVIAIEHGFSKEDMVMIGDNYDTDIMCGINFGCDTIHVNTGVTPTKIVLEKEQQPTYIVDTL